MVALKTHNHVWCLSLEVPLWTRGQYLLQLQWVPYLGVLLALLLAGLGIQDTQHLYWYLSLWQQKEPISRMTWAAPEVLAPPIGNQSKNPALPLDTLLIWQNRSVCSHLCRCSRPCVVTRVGHVLHFCRTCIDQRPVGGHSFVWGDLLLLLARDW